MKPKTLILMVVAVVCGLGASYLTSRLLAEREEVPTEAAVVKRVTLLVAKKNVEMHTPLRKKPDDFFQEKQFTEEDAPKDALTPEDLPKLKDKFLKRSLRKGDHLTPEDLMDGKFGLPALPNGMRAVGIRVNAEQIAGGFASLPGSHVDIMWTLRRGGDGDTFSKVLLENVVVLAADASTHNEGNAIVASVVTVALYPDDAMKLNLAMETGSLRLVVRNLEDGSSSDKERVSMAELVRDRNAKSSKGSDTVPDVEPPPPVVAETPKTVDTTPQPKLTKMTATIRNGPDVQIRVFWLNENDEVVPAPLQEQNPIPRPADTGKKDDGGY